MKEILETIILTLVEDTSAVSVKEVNDGNNIVYQVEVAENDMGRVIGKQGRIAKSIRTVMRAIAIKENKKVSVEFIG